MILLPAMDTAQQAAWHSLLDLYELQPDGVQQAVGSVPVLI